MVDIHSHLLPGIDDGAENLADSLSLLALYARQGVTDIVCTPHLQMQDDISFTPSAFQAALDRRDEVLHMLAGRASELYPGIRLLAGAEIMLSSGLPGILRLFARRCKLADSNYLLVETPSFLSGGLRAIDRMLFQIQLEGLTPILAHPERMSLSESDIEMLAEWVDQGRLLLQVNASSFQPSEGIPVDRRDRHHKRQRLIDRLVHLGAIHVVASDTHGPDVRPPVLSEAHEYLSNHYGTPLADRLCRENPRHIIEDGSVEAGQILRPAR